MPENENILDKLSHLILTKNKKSFEIVETNFTIGQRISEIYNEKGESSIKDIASSLKISENFLFDTHRVFKSFKNIWALRQMQKKFGGKLNWGFLVNECTRAPEGDTEEARIFWSSKLSQMEKSFEEAEALAATYYNLPESVKEQVKGFLQAASSLEPSLLNQPRTILEGDYKFGHIGDIHMDDNFTVAGRTVIDSKTGKNERLLDIHKCFSYAIDKIIEAGCRACFIPGDATETPNPSPNVQGYLQYNLMRLAEHIPVIIEPGNHGLSKEPKDASALEFLKGRKNIYVVEKPTILYQEGLNISDKPSDTWPQKDCVKIFVLPFPSRGIAGEDADTKSIEELNKIVSLKLKTQVEYFRSEIDTSVPNILLAHIAIEGAKGTDSKEMLRYDPALSPDDLRGFEYVALNHIHIFQQVSNNAYFSGSTDRMDFNEENDPKGFIIGAIKDKTPHIEFIETPARVLKTLEPDFFENPEWINKTDSRTIYRIKGEVTKEQYEELKPKLKDFPLPILNKLTVKRTVRVRDEKITEEIKTEAALERFLETQNHDKPFIKQCIEKHNSLIQGKEDESDSSLLKAA